MAAQTKVCSKCNLSKKLSKFHNCKRSGKRSECKKCRSIIEKEQRERKLPPPKKIESLEEEKWVEIQLHRRPYAVSNKLRIKALPSKWSRDEYIINQRIYNNGYICIKLVDNYKDKNYSVHRIIAKAFIPNPKHKPCVNHLNGIKIDNRIENLQWATQAENAKHAFEMGLTIPSRGEDHYLSKLNRQQVIEIFNSPLKQKELAVLYSVSVASISQIKRGRSYRSITNASLKKRRDQSYQKMVIEIYKSEKRNCELVKLYPVSLTTIKRIKKGDNSILFKKAV